MPGFNPNREDGLLENPDNIIRALQLPESLEPKAQEIARQFNVRIYNTDKGPQYDKGIMFLGFSRTERTTPEDEANFEDALDALARGKRQ